MILHHAGFPIRKSPDITLIYSSPRLIAVSHVLLRLLMPRHSPYALFCLNFSCLSFANNCCFGFMKKLAEFPPSFHSTVCRPFMTAKNCSANHSVGVFALLISSERPIFRFVFLTQLSVRFFFCLIRFSMTIWKFLTTCMVLPCFTAAPAAGGLKWTRTTDLALIRRAL